MATNVYLTNSGAYPVKVSLKFLGPDDRFNSNFGDLFDTNTEITGGQGPIQVLSVSRGPIIGSARTMAELRVAANGSWMGSLVFLIDDRGAPVKNTLNWMIRGPGAATMALVSDRNAHELHFTAGSLSVRLEISGRSSGLFDDVYFDVRVHPVGDWTKLAASVDVKLGRVLLMAIGGDQRPYLCTAPRATEPPAFVPVTLNFPQTETLSHHFAVIDNSFDSTQPTWVVGLTNSLKLWAQRNDRTVSHMIDASPPLNGGRVASLAVSDAFTNDGILVCDVFLAILTPKQDYHLFRRTLKLADELTWYGGAWDDWGQITSHKASYVRNRNGRFIFVVRGQGAGVAVQYACANATGLGESKLSGYGLWTSTRDLPSGVSTNKVLGFTWGAKGGGVDGLAVAIRGDDGFLYCASKEARPSYNWCKSSTAKPDGDEMMAVYGSNEVPLVYRDFASRQLLFARWMVKEAAFILGGAVTATTPPAFSGFGLDAARQYVVWQVPDGSVITTKLERMGG